MRDSQRQRVYDAEDSCLWYTHHRTMTWIEVNTFIKKVMTSPFVRGRYKNMEPLKIVNRGNRREAAKAWSWGVKLPEWAWNKSVILHELAHTLEHDHHGPEFCWCYVQLVEKFLGRYQADELRMAFRCGKVKVA